MRAHRSLRRRAPKSRGGLALRGDVVAQARFGPSRSSRQPARRAVTPAEVHAARSEPVRRPDGLVSRSRHWRRRSPGGLGLVVRGARLVTTLGPLQEGRRSIPAGSRGSSPASVLIRLVSRGSSRSLCSTAAFPTCRHGAVRFLAGHRPKGTRRRSSSSSASLRRAGRARRRHRRLADGMGCGARSGTRVWSQRA